MAGRPGAGSASILFGIVDNLTAPKRVGGVVKVEPGHSPRAALLDYVEQPVSIDSGQIDSITGAVALHYSPLWVGQARALRLTTRACRDDDHPLPRAALRSGSDFQWEHKCTPTTGGDPVMQARPGASAP